MNLKNCVDLVENNNDCVVLKVKPDKKIDLICLGCFLGDETMIRLTKGNSVTCTIWRDNGNHVSWHWGLGGYTLVTDDLHKAGRMIQDCIETGFGIKCKY